MWNNVPRVFLWNHDGDYGFDGGLDDDELPFTGQDINFDQRSYSEFSGLPADGEFVLRVEDWVEGDTGRLTHLEVEVEYFLPERRTSLDPRFRSQKRLSCSPVDSLFMGSGFLLFLRGR